MDLKDDLIGPGARRIAQETGETPRRVLHLVERHGLPVIERGGKLYSRRSWLDAYYSGREIPDPPPPYTPKARAKPAKPTPAPEMIDVGACEICGEPMFVEAGKRGRHPKAHPECRARAKQER